MFCFGNSKARKFKRHLRTFKNKIKIENKCKRVTIITPNNKARLSLNLNGDEIYYAIGRTNKNARRRGYGTLLRAIPILAAKNTGYKRIRQIGSFINNNNRNGNIPPSTRIVLKLGFVPVSPHPNRYESVLNLSKADYNRIRRLVYR